MYVYIYNSVRWSAYILTLFPFSRLYICFQIDCVYVCICMYKYIMYIYIYIHTYKMDTNTHTHTYMLTLAVIYKLVTCIQTFMCNCVHVFIVSTWICECVCTLITKQDTYTIAHARNVHNIYIYIYIYVHAYIHTYTCTIAHTCTHMCAMFYSHIAIRFYT